MRRRRKATALQACSLPLAASTAWTRRLAAAVVAGALLAWGATPASAGVTTTAVGGALSAVENGCLVVSAFFYGVDCSYDGHLHGAAAAPLLWVGPTLGPVFFAPGDPHGVPSYTPSGDEPHFAPPVNGTLSIDDRGTADPADDLVSGTWRIAAGLRSHLSRINENSPVLRVIESWSLIDHTLAPTPVNRAIANAAGGQDYALASAGLPPRLCRKDTPTDCFPSAAAPLLTDGKWGADSWAVPSRLPLGRSPMLGNNVGARTTAVMQGYACTDTAQGTLCANGINLWGAREEPGWDNLLLLLSTDAAGHVLRAEGFWLDEYRVDAGPAPLRGPEGQDNSWLGGYLELTAGGVPAAGQTATPSAP